MSTEAMTLATRRLVLRLQTAEEIHAQLARLSAEERTQVSPAWLALATSTSKPDPWTHGFIVTQREDGAEVGSASFKSPPDHAGVVELAYVIHPEYRLRGYATEAAGALAAFAFASGRVRLVCAHTLPNGVASGRVLAKCGFQFVGEVDDPEDGLIHRWELTRPSTDA